MKLLSTLFALGFLLSLTACQSLQAAPEQTYHVHPQQGDDAGSGAKGSPWRTISASMEKLQPGDTLLLHGGRYFESVTCSIWGSSDAPITIRGVGDEPVIIDGGWSQFATSPETSWEPVPEKDGGAPGEYRSTKRFGNIVDAAGMFHDRPIRLNTYWRLADLQTSNELRNQAGEKRILTNDIYAGPGLWYDRESGHIHIRLAHTKLDSDLVEPYKGETDPRKLPLTITDFRTTPLVIDSARYVNFENITVTGGGIETILITDSQKITFERVNTHGGNLRGEKSGHVTMRNCVFDGGLPPWVWRIDVSGGSAASRSRDIIRVSPLKMVVDLAHSYYSHNLPRHIKNDYRLLRPVGRTKIELDTIDAQVPQMRYMLQNHDWEIAYCEIKRAHDGIFLAGTNMNMHHCAIDDTQDDAFDPSSPVAFISQNIHFHHNLVRKCVTALSSHNYRDRDGWVHIYNNVFDLREPMAWNRPSVDGEPAMGRKGKGFMLHGDNRSESIESYNISHNVFIIDPWSRYFFAAGTHGSVKPGSIRRVYNNIFMYMGDYPRYFVSKSLEGMDFLIDGNLHWAIPSMMEKESPKDYLKAFNEHEYSQGRWEANSIVADPLLRNVNPTVGTVNDFRPTPQSPAIGAGVAIPEVGEVKAKPAGATIGAFEVNDEPLRVGVDSRIVAGEPLK